MAWTQATRSFRSSVSAWAAARRKAAQRAEEARAAYAAGDVPVGEAWVIVQRIAAESGEPLADVAAAAGLDPADIEG